MKRIKAIDLFSGCGGVSCGLTKSGFVVKAAVEVDEDAANIYSGYHALSNVLVLKKDICTVTGKELLSAAGIKPGEMYLMAGCPPCQNFSIQNPKNKEKSMALRKKLFFQFLRIIKETYPPFILMENVPGIANKTNEKILMQFLRELENKKDKKSRQYIIKKGILNAADYGVPQIRMRFVLHGIRADIYDRLKELNTGFELPTATHSRDGKNNLKKWVTAKEAIGDLPRIQAGSSYKGRKQIYNHKCAGLSGQNMERMKYIRKHGGSRTCLPPKMALECHSKKRDNGTIFNGHKDVYGIMNGNRPAPTMTGGCLFYTKGRYGHYSQNRAISIREAARFQTFPDDFVFGDSLSKSALQIGNAVPVRLVEASGTEIIKAIRTINKSNRRRGRENV